MAADPYRYFRTEARELGDQLGKSILDLEKGPAPELVAKVLRLAHTLKGAARVVKQREIADAAHAIEGAITPHRDSKELVPRDVIDTVLRHLDAVGRAVAALVPLEAPGVAAPEGEVFRTAQADVADVVELINGLGEVCAQVASLRRSLDATGRSRRLIELLGEQLAAPRAREHGDAASSTVQSVVDELGQVFGGLARALATSVEQLDRDLRQVRDSAERLRLVPARLLFTGLERMVREGAQALGRRVAFEGRGGEVRLDGNVLGTMQAALLQVVGNAVAHGIEPEADRRAAGKPLEGRIVLEVARRGRQVVFTCQDDGRGVDLEAIRRVAQRRGLPAPEALRLGTDELLRLLLRGGISTSGAVSEVAGRGIGLDVVREAVERLGGAVSVRTEAGKGTAMELAVPLSLAALQVLLVEGGGLSAAIPLEAVRSAMRLHPRDVSRSPEGESVTWEGKVLPFVSMARALGGGARRALDAVARSAVIVEGRGGLAAIGVDRLLGTASVVLRALPELAPAKAVVAGASLDADSRPQLVLDPDALVAEALGGGPPERAPPAPRLQVLIIDDSLTTRMLEQSILESAGYDVDVAASGEEALEKASQKRYSLFLVDIEMPGIDGFTFIERTRADPSLSDIPSILVSSRASQTDRARGLHVGARAYIAKSEFEQTELLERIRKLVG